MIGVLLVIFILTYFLSSIAYSVLKLIGLISQLDKPSIFFLGVGLGILFFIISFIFIVCTFPLEGDER